ncbi:extracellular solute-binding protein [Jiangella rhizosphaerae]|uniref:Extracellular solute-binding protein n=1 Tax=Jiangella rhizosphaerae TaxID=2293569 RepID=A0A418KH63_9ACTN|nr:extracellular solute-binding protein [Jiangella rhizosphaerae]RIQ11321.1 extracellular solute-binding protein [Jiangella rhizosphaerae]
MSLTSRRSLRLASLCAATAVAVAACGSGDDSGTVADAAALDACDPDGVTITAMFADQGKVPAEAAKAELEQRHPGLTVDLKLVGTASYDDLTQQMVTDIAAGSRPDVGMVGLGQVRFWVDRYQPVPLDPDTLPATYDRSYLDAGSVDGVPYIAPFQVSMAVLYTNTTLAESAGVTELPDSTSELVDAARAIRATTGNAPVSLPRDGIADWVAQSFIQSAGVTFVEDDGTAGFDTPEGHEALSVYSDLAAEDLIAPVGALDATELFTTGQLAYLVTSPASAVSIGQAVGDAFEWTVSDFPVPDGGSPVLPAGGNGWMVLSDDACRAAYANEMITTMLSPQIIADSARQYSYAPVDTQAAEELAADPLADTPVGYAWRYDGKVTPWGGWHDDNTPRVNTLLTEMVQRLTNGEPLDTVVPDTTAQIDALVAR